MGNSNIKILILGHNGMLGHMAYNFFKNKGFCIETTDFRFPSNDFSFFLENSNSDFLINCIGSIPQKKPINYDSNYLIPKIICEKFKGIIIHPSSDCEDNIHSEYDLSKRNGTDIILKHHNSHIIQCSIIGPEKLSSYGLWSWMENNKNYEIYGYSNHLWNGITTLDWCQICYDIIKCNNVAKKIIAGTKTISKFNLLYTLNKNLYLNKKIIEYAHINPINRVLNASLIRDDIDVQIKNLIIWRQNNMKI